MTETLRLALLYSMYNAKMCTRRLRFNFAVKFVQRKKNCPNISQTLMTCSTMTESYCPQHTRQHQNVNAKHQRMPHIV